nr:hypothetical protein [Pseudomonas syringae]
MDGNKAGAPKARCQVFETAGSAYPNVECREDYQIIGVVVRSLTKFD